MGHHGRAHDGPMPYTEAAHLLHPLRGLILSPKRLVSRLNLRPSDYVLELGPGPGYFSPEAASAVPEGKLVLVDVQPEMLDMARERLEKQGVGNVEYRVGDALSLPAGDREFDAVFLSSVLGETPDQAACLSEIHRVLKPGGLLSITEHKISDPDAIPKNDMLTLIKAAGFKLQAQYGVLLYYTINCRKPA